MILVSYQMSFLWVSPNKTSLKCTLLFSEVCSFGVLAYGNVQ